MRSMKNMIIILAATTLAACGGKPEGMPAMPDYGLGEPTETTEQPTEDTSERPVEEEVYTCESGVEIQEHEDGRCGGCAAQFCCSESSTLQAEDYLYRVESVGTTMHGLIEPTTELVNCLNISCDWLCYSFRNAMVNQLDAMHDLDLAGDTCRYALDDYCDEGDYCPSGTDTTDCEAEAAAIEAAENTCQYAYDGVCDEGALGLWFCDDGTDTADCSD